MRYLVLACVLAGCPDRSIGKVDPVQTGEIDKDIPLSADVDILFVIDDSLSTSDKQTVFAQNFPMFVAALDAFPSGRPNVHIGVVSTSVDVGADVGTPVCHPAANENGKLQPSRAGCTSTVMGNYIKDVADPAGGRSINYTGTLADAFSCTAQLGSTGCGFEAPLEAIKRALDGSRPENAGFIRDGAYLAVVILTDEDDCSVADPSLFSLPVTQVGQGDFRCQPMFAYDCDRSITLQSPASYTGCKVRTGSYLADPASYFSFLSGLKGAGKTVVALIAGDPKPDISVGPLVTPSGTQDPALEPSCMATINGNTAVGRPAIRLSAFQQQFGDHGLFSSVCQSDYSATLDQVGKLLFEAISPCLGGRLDLTDIDPNNPGTQLQCNVSYVTNPDTDSPVETRIPACQMQDPMTPMPGGARPCWWTSVDAASCPTTTTGVVLHVEKTMEPPTGTVTRVRCAAQ